MVIFKNVRDKTQFSHLTKQFMANNIKFIAWTYKDATKLGRSYLLFDLKPETNDKYSTTVCLHAFNGEGII